MSENNKPKVIHRKFDTYLAVINNSEGSLMFKNVYVDVGGIKKDAAEDGWLSCAFYVSAVFTLFGYIERIHGTVKGTVDDLKKSGWAEIKDPVPGSVIVWKAGQGTNGHSHIGFYVGDGLAMSNDSYKKYPIKYDWKFNGKREVEMILWNGEIMNLSDSSEKNS